MRFEYLTTYAQMSYESEESGVWVFKEARDQVKNAHI
jgi:hypothetical protein